MVTCPRSTAPCILANILKFFPSFSLLSSTLLRNIIGTASDPNFFHFMRSSSDANLSLGWIMPSWIMSNKRGGRTKNVMVYIFSKKN